ncbi:gamma-glutamyl-gamma-aminobutyrate hydrolase family protein [Pelagibius litoralis]|uniref:gamma-glutamyl-gamma-aminobutyrate hydrolase n=1 Tax=Pelagibius litoralis TaxID=374515 RepID=A0A967F112_9PROT|nr:gamma-glutamyl-gamma-aminobutyrate hydrolase family protein [Pelagibius litoralis]NIA71001.1 gamma-glutamyl-gamma-aminobutyrate hydrolase family protein [Pelagibius litoralis]
MSNGPSFTAAALVGVPACIHDKDGQPFHAVGDKYVRALAVCAGAVPLMIPSLGEDLLDLRALLRRLDGLMMTGSPSNVHPDHYDQAETPEAEPFDRARDATSLALIRLALEEGVPLLAICRGFQELNVALGGTLHPRVHEIDGRMDHRRPQHPEFDVQYGPKHPVRLRPDGPFATMASAESLMVNSLHWQALDRIADGLTEEAWAEDGTVEAVSVSGADAFALGVQWHPEYKAWENPFSARLFADFGTAVQNRAALRRNPEKPTLTAVF